MITAVLTVLGIFALAGLLWGSLALGFWLDGDTEYSGFYFGDHTKCDCCWHSEWGDVPWVTVHEWDRQDRIVTEAALKVWKELPMEQKAAYSRR